MSAAWTAQTLLVVSQHYTLYISFVILFVGVLGNVCNIVTMSYLKILRQNPSAFYLISESVVNCLALLTSFLARIGINAFNYDPSQTSLVWCKLRQALGQAYVLISYTILCLAAFDQYLSTHHRPYVRQMSTLKLARTSVTVTVLIWTVHSIPLLVWQNIRPPAGCIVDSVGLTAYVTYVYYPVLSGLLPIVVSCVFSLLAFSNVRRIVRRQMPVVRRRLDRQMSSMILIRVVFLILLTLPYTIQRIYTLISPPERTDLIGTATLQLVGAVTISFLYINIAGSFYLFIISSRRYRRQIKYILFKILGKLRLKVLTPNNRVAPVLVVSAVETS